jgi:NAD(P)-dependent dehydrogenase (short-subunit alcohol dehydrogenase family)
MIGEALQRSRELAGGIASRLVNPGGRPSDDELREAVEGRVILVTGASHGIGRATAMRLAGAGAVVLALARSADELDALTAEAEAADGEVHPYPADLTELDAIPELCARILERHGPPDVIVNNAGKSIRRSIELSYDRFHDFTRTIDVNYLGPVRMLLELLPPMRERGSGHIVNVSSIGVVVPPAPRWSAYQASKAAFDVWLRSAAPETRDDGVTATTVYLALVHTRMSAPTDEFNQVPGLKPEEAADLVCNAIVERQSSVMPWWATAGAIVGELARGPVEFAMRRYYRLTEDSASARGERR